METLGRRLKQARLRKNISQIKVAPLVDLTNQSQVSAHECGLMTPSEKTLEKYAALYDVSVVWLRYGVIESENDPKIDTRTDLEKRIESLEINLDLIKKLLRNIINNNPGLTV